MDCIWFNTHHCRSCDLLDHSYRETIEIKERTFRSLFIDRDVSLKTTVTLEGLAHQSRNKAKLAVRGFGDHLEFGFYDSSLQFKKLENCPLHTSGINELLPVLKKVLSDFKISAYSTVEKKGELKYVIISKSEKYNDFLIRFVLRSKESLDRLKKLSHVLPLKIPEIKVVTANIQPEHKAIMEGEEEIVLTKNISILHQFGDISLNLGPRSFFQVTPSIASKLYHTVGQMVREYKIQSFLDLYCGVGAFSFFAARSCPLVLGVEISKEAILAAQSSIALNSVCGVIDFKALDVEIFLHNLHKNFQAILVNPPRRGLNESILSSLLIHKPEFIFYSSCNAVTLARDVQRLDSAYQIVSSQIFDMFPYTEHFETLMLLRRKET